MKYEGRSNMSATAKSRAAARFVLLLCAVGAALLIAYIVAPIPFVVPMSDVAAVEQWAARDPCVGTLSAWSRTYRFVGSAGQATPDFNRVVVSFGDPNVPLPDGTVRSAGVYRPWRNSLVFGHSYVDHRQQRVAFGVYDRRIHSMKSWHCGCNVGQETRSTLPECNPR